MKTRFLGASALIALLASGSAMAAEYTHIAIEKDVNASADTVWKKVGGFCALTEWLKIPDCTLTSPYFEGEGCGADGNWTPERSVLAFRVARRAAARLGRRFRQNAVIFVSYGKPAELMMLR